MFSKEVPLWVVTGGVLLTLAAGSINAVGFLGVHHQAITHLSGTLTIAGTEAAHGAWPATGRALGVVAAFFFGAFCSGVILRQSTLKLGRRYGVALSCEATLLVLAVFFFRKQSIWGEYLASVACGLQNAIATSYSGAVIRTWHMTGIVTDLGLALGHAVRGQPVDGRKVRLYAALLAGFTVGGVVGTWGFQRFSYDTLLFPAAFAGISGVVYTLYKHAQRSA